MNGHPGPRLTILQIETIGYVNAKPAAEPRDVAEVPTEKVGIRVDGSDDSQVGSLQQVGSEALTEGAQPYLHNTDSWGHVHLLI